MVTLYVFCGQELNCCMPLPGAVPLRRHTRVPAAEHRAQSDQRRCLQAHAVHQHTVRRPHILHRRGEYSDGEGACLEYVSHDKGDHS